MNGIPKPSGPSQKNQHGWQRLIMVFGFYLLITVIAAFLIGGLFGSFGDGLFSEDEQIEISQLINAVENNEVDRIIVQDDEIEVYFDDDRVVTSRKEPGTSIYEILDSAGVEDISEKVTIEVAPPSLNDFWGALLSQLIPVAIIIIVLLFIFRQAGKSAGGVFDFGKSTAKIFNKDQPKVTFEDAAGVDEAKKELEEVVDFLRNPEKYRKLGARIPKGVLLIGPAGTGKTLLARAVANEANVPFFSMAGSEFMEMLVGVGASRVRDLFKTAKENSPAVIFIDEIETIGRSRGQLGVSSHGEQEQTLNQILVEMDGFTPSDNVIVVAATNRPDMLDNALTRPGRFDRTVTLQLPDVQGRRQIIGIHTDNKPLSEDVDLDRVARMTVGFSGADLENMLNEAAILAAAHGKDKIYMSEVTESITKVKLGRERRRIQSDEDKRITAYHEAGHALVAKKSPDMDPVQRVSIVSRGMALGFTEINPEVERSHQTRSELLNRITAMLGGRAAEVLVFDDMTVGAHDDLKKANSIAYKMVTEFGMSSLGPMAFNIVDQTKTMVDPMLDRTQHSQEMMAKVDHEVKEIMDNCFAKAIKILQDDRKTLDAIVDALMEEETIEKEEFDAIVEGEAKSEDE